MVKKVAGVVLIVTALLVYAGRTPVAKSFMHNMASGFGGALNVALTTGIPDFFNALQGGGSAPAPAPATPPAPANPTTPRVQ